MQQRVLFALKPILVEFVSMFVSFYHVYTSPAVFSSFFIRAVQLFSYCSVVHIVLEKKKKFFSTFDKNTSFKLTKLNDCEKFNS
jgi:hypothetical protein